jgi:type I restriction enzyme S subunit
MEVLTGFPFASKSFSDGKNNVRLLRGDNIVQGGLRWDSAKCWPCNDLEAYASWQLAEGDVVVAMDRPWIEAGLKHARLQARDLPCLLVQRVARLRADESMDQGFLFALIASPAFTTHVLSVQTGTAVPHISARQIGDFKFLIPPLDEQRRIAGVLGALDDKIEHTHTLVGRLRQVADLRFRQLFLGSDERSRRSLSHVASLQRETVDPAEHPGELFEHFSIPAFDNGRWPALEVGAQILSGKTRLPRGDVILLSKLNPATPRVWWPRATARGEPVCSGEFVVLVPTEVPATFLYASLRNDSALYDEILSHATGTTGSRQRVKPSEVLSSSLLDAEANELDVYDSFARPVYDLEAALIAESQHLSAIRDALLPRLISGAVGVPDTYDPDDAIGTVAEAAVTAPP